MWYAAVLPHAKIWFVELNIFTYTFHLHSLFLFVSEGCFFFPGGMLERSNIKAQIKSNNPQLIWFKSYTQYVFAVTANPDPDSIPAIMLTFDWFSFENITAPTATHILFWALVPSKIVVSSPRCVIWKVYKSNCRTAVNLETYSESCSRIGNLIWVDTHMFRLAVEKSN